MESNTAQIDEKWSMRIVQLKMAIRRLAEMKAGIGHWQRDGKIGVSEEHREYIRECKELFEALKDKLLGEGFHSVLAELKKDFKDRDSEKYYYYLRLLNRRQEIFRANILEQAED